MNFKKKLLLGSSILAFISPVGIASAQNAETTWQARTVEEVLAEIVISEDNKVSYTVKYGDTLSVISEAMEIEEHVLAEINQIENVDLIFPETILTAQYDSNRRVESLTIESPSGEIVEVAIPVNLSVFPEVTENVSEVVVETPVTNTEVEAPEVENDEAPNQSSPAAIESTLPAPSGPEAGAQEPAAPAPIEVPTWIEAEPTEVEVVEETVVTEPVIEQPIVEEVIVEEPVIEQPIVEEVIVEEPVIEQPIVEEVVVEEPVIEQPIVEEVVEEPVIEQPIVEEVPVYEEEVTEIPEDIYEDIQVEEVITEEDIVTEEPVVVEEPYTPEVDPMDNPQNNGLQPHAAAYKEEVADIYGIDSFSLYRPGDAQDHGQGLAVDFMVPVGSQLGDDVANYSINNMASNNISYVIWEQQIYGDWNHQWTPMEDRGSITANHYDHVHVSFNPY